MRPWIIHWHQRTLGWHSVSLHYLLAVALLLVAMVSPVDAYRLQDRSVYMNSSEAGATTFYRISWRYMSPDPIGSVEMLFCEDPIPYHPCVIPDGLNVAGAVLTHQSGETGFVISQQTQNKIVLSRAAVPPTLILLITSLTQPKLAMPSRCA
jgi:hypothetical protein